MTAFDRPAIATVVEVLSRRGALEVFEALLQGPMSERALVSHRGVTGTVARQRVEQLRRLGVVEVVPESGKLRLSPQGRRLQGLLEQLAAWSRPADGGR